MGTALDLPEAAVIDDFAEDDVFDTAILMRDDTGIDGTIFVSSALGSLAPRVKWYLGRPDRLAPCLSMTLEPPPRAVNHRLPAHLARAGEGPLRDWVLLDRLALLDYWDHGLGWSRAEVNAFFDGLRKRT